MFCCLLSFIIVQFTLLCLQWLHIWAFLECRASTLHRTWIISKILQHLSVVVLFLSLDYLTHSPRNRFIWGDAVAAREARFACWYNFRLLLVWWDFFLLCQCFLLNCWTGCWPSAMGSDCSCSAQSWGRGSHIRFNLLCLLLTFSIVTRHLRSWFCNELLGVIHSIWQVTSWISRLLESNRSRSLCSGVAWRRLGYFLVHRHAEETLHRIVKCSQWNSFLLTEWVSACCLIRLHILFQLLLALLGLLLHCWTDARR